MADEVAASTMVTYFTSCMAQLRGRAVYVQFSNHKELKTDQTHSNAVSAVLFIVAFVCVCVCVCVCVDCNIVQAMVAIQKDNSVTYVKKCDF
jgi:cytochrome bd-type quinol oxidase subunit 2